MSAQTFLTPMRRGRALLAASVALAAVLGGPAFGQQTVRHAPARRANLLVNGSFERGPRGGGYTTLAAGSKEIGGWTVTKATVDYIDTYWKAPGGSPSVDLDGTPGSGGIGQTIATMPGREYVVTFDFAGNAQGAPVVKKLEVTAAGQSAAFSYDTSKVSGMAWTREAWRFTAKAATTTIEFYSLDEEGGAFGPVIANVSVAPSLAPAHDRGR